MAHYGVKTYQNKFWDRRFRLLAYLRLLIRELNLTSVSYKK